MSHMMHRLALVHRRTEACGYQHATPRHGEYSAHTGSTEHGIFMKDELVMLGLSRANRSCESRCKCVRDSSQLTATTHRKGTRSWKCDGVIRIRV